MKSFQNQNYFVIINNNKFEMQENCIVPRMLCVNLIFRND